MKKSSVTIAILALLFIAFSFTGRLSGQNPKEEEMTTVIYKVPPTFLNYESSSNLPASDPFAEPAAKDTALIGKRKTAKSTLEEAGVSVPPGASAIYNSGTGELIVRNTQIQHDLIQAYLEAIAGNGEKQINIIVELIEVEHLDFSDWLLKNRLDTDGTELRLAAQEWVKQGRASIAETSMIAARSGQRAKTESGPEYIYPSEYDPIAFPEELSLSDNASLQDLGIIGSAFETRNLGFTLEVDPVLGADDYTIDLNLAPDKTELEGETSWPNEDADPKLKTTMPTFYRMRVTTQVTTLDGRYCFLGTTRPRDDGKSDLDDPLILQFVRADIGKVHNWSVRESE